jgi:hypothetical protein
MLSLVLLSSIVAVSEATGILARPWWKAGNKLFGPMFTNGDGGEQFGDSVAIYNDLLVVGAPMESAAGGDGSGAAYVFQRDADNVRNWSLLVRLVASDGAPGANFGHAIQIQGGVLAISAHTMTKTFNNQGAVYIYDISDRSSVTEEIILYASDAGENDAFGSSLAMDLPLLVVGAPFNDNTVLSGGAVYVFDNSGGSFGPNEKAKIFPSDDIAVADFFGSAVAVDGYTLVASSISDDDIGSAYIYTSTDETADQASWELDQRISPRKAGRDDDVGRSVGIEGGIIVLGAAKSCDIPWYLFWLPGFIKNWWNNRINDNLGRVYVYKKRSTGSWRLTATLGPPYGPSAESFGRAVAIKNERIIVGAPGADRLAGSRTAAGKVFIFQPLGRSLNHWRLSVQLTPFDVQNGDEFGTSVAFSNGTLATGSRQEDEQGLSSGAAYTYRKAGLVVSNDADL